MAVSKLEPKAKPTNRDLQEQVIEVHGCLHMVDAKVDGQGLQIRILAKAMGVQLPPIPGQVDAIPTPKVRRRLGGLDPIHAIVFAAPAITLGITGYKVLEPAIVAFIGALHHGLMAAQ